MIYEWLVKDKIAFTKTDKNLLFSDKSIIEQNEFTMLVTVEKDDCRLIWKYNDSNEIRHYMYTVSKYPNANEWELYEFNELLNYEIEHGRKVLLWFELDSMLEVFTASIKQRFLEGKVEKLERPYKLEHCKACKEKGCLTDIFCHTSSIEHGKLILSSGKLLSSKNARGVSVSDLMYESRNAAGDPADYFDYVMLSYGNCIAGDRLVTERRVGRCPNDSDLSENFYPGIRYYFRRKDIELNSEYCFDGYHAGKVRDFIDLSKYMICCIIPKSEENNFKNIISQSLIDKVIFVENKETKDIFEWTSKAFNIANKQL
jgi:hypothetical protein